VSHDQRFKEFLREFFQEFLELFYPDVEARLLEAYASVEELDACLERILTVTSLEEMGLET